MRRFFVRFNRSESFVHTQSSAGFTIITSGFEFSVHTAKDRGERECYERIVELYVNIAEELETLIDG